jgi:hypothetical protein
MQSLRELRSRRRRQGKLSNNFPCRHRQDANTQRAREKSLGSWGIRGLYSLFPNVFPNCDIKRLF